MTGLESGLGALLVLAMAVVVWLSAVNAREQAYRAAREFCQRQEWQLLDQTVALRSLWPTRTRHGLRLKRRYRFEFSLEGTGRRRGGLTMVDRELVRDRKSTRLKYDYVATSYA